MRSSTPVQKCIAPSSQTAINGVTCGRPSGRTVDSQNIPACSRVRSASAHGVGDAFSLLNRWSSTVSGCSVDMFVSCRFMRPGETIICPGSILDRPVTLSWCSSPPDRPPPTVVQMHLLDTVPADAKMQTNRVYSCILQRRCLLRDCSFAGGTGERASSATIDRHIQRGRAATTRTDPPRARDRALRPCYEG